MNKPITFPPGIWLTVVVAAAAFVQDQFPFPDYWWSPGIVIILGTAAKLLEVYTPVLKGSTDVQSSGNRGYLWTNRAWRFWIGG